jgi:hypothetical protein
MSLSITNIKLDDIEDNINGPTTRKIPGTELLTHVRVLKKFIKSRTQTIGILSDNPPQHSLYRQLNLHKSQAISKKYILESTRVGINNKRRTEVQIK